MAFREIRDNIEDIQDNAKSFVESSFEYYKLFGFKVAMKSATLLFKFILIGVCLVIVLMFLSFAAALAIGQEMGNYVFGFLIVAGVYLVISFLLYLFKDKLIEGPILDKFSEIFYND